MEFLIYATEGKRILYSTRMNDLKFHDTNGGTGITSVNFGASTIGLCVQNIVRFVIVDYTL